MSAPKPGPDVARLHHREEWEEEERCPTTRFWSWIAAMVFGLLVWTLVSWGLVAWLG